mgnify:CR=1 FL=1
MQRPLFQKPRAFWSKVTEQTAFLSAACVSASKAIFTSGGVLRPQTSARSQRFAKGDKPSFFLIP